jgi:hypothetical protein
MANPEHLAVLSQGVPAWNEWRERIGDAGDLSDTKLVRRNLSGAFC